MVLHAAGRSRNVFVIQQPGISEGNQETKSLCALSLAQLGAKRKEPLGNAFVRRNDVTFRALQRFDASHHHCGKFVVYIIVDNVVSHIAAPVCVRRVCCGISCAALALGHCRCVGCQLECVYNIAINLGKSHILHPCSTCARAGCAPTECVWSPNAWGACTPATRCCCLTLCCCRRAGGNSPKSQLPVSFLLVILQNSTRLRVNLR